MFSPDGTLISASAAPHCGDIDETVDVNKLFLMNDHGMLYYFYECCVKRMECTSLFVKEDLKLSLGQ